MSAEAGNEPSDSIRAVNALLTQIDRIKRYPNVVILTTSNIVGSIDLAFVDRADLKIYIGPPPSEIIYEIYSSSINELLRVGIISSSPNEYLPEKACEMPIPSSCVQKLQVIAKNSFGMSGRALRKIPFLTHVNFIRNQTCNLETFLDAMAQCIEIEKNETDMLCNSSNKKNLQTS
jgi:AAA+ superfamily predicted ATPase